MAHLAKNLVQSVVRAFYDIEHTVIIDALVLHLAYECSPALRAAERECTMLTAGTGSLSMNSLW